MKRHVGEGKSQKAKKNLRNKKEDVSNFEQKLWERNPPGSLLHPTGETPSLGYTVPPNLDISRFVVEEFLHLKSTLSDTSSHTSSAQYMLPSNVTRRMVKKQEGYDHCLIFMDVRLHLLVWSPWRWQVFFKKDTPSIKINHEVGFHYILFRASRSLDYKIFQTSTSENFNFESILH